MFCNPPYGRELPKWIEKCAKESKHAKVVMLIPARIEETSELNQAIVKHHRYGTMDGILEELADVEIMLAQIRMALNEEQLARVDLITQSKLERQIARIRSDIKC